VKTLQSIRKYGQYHRPVARPVVFWLNGGRFMSPGGLCHKSDDFSWRSAMAVSPLASLHERPRTGTGWGCTAHRGYIIVDDQLQTSVSGISVPRDCDGRGVFIHTSCNDYAIVADSLFNADQSPSFRPDPAYAPWIDPPLGRCEESQPGEALCCELATVSL
jgi:hypothetical protein